MPRVRFTYALQRFYPTLSEEQCEAGNLKNLLDEIDQTYPGIRAYLIEDSGAIRKHVNIFLDGKLLRDRGHLEHNLEGVQEVYIMQALSGG